MKLKNIRKSPEDPVVTIELDNNYKGTAFIRSTTTDKTAELGVTVTRQTRTGNGNGMEYKCTFTPDENDPSSVIAALFARNFTYKCIGDSKVIQTEVQLEKNK